MIMAAWTLKKMFRFEASHQLMKHDGKCARLHGHSWRGEIEVKSHYLTGEGPKENMVVDFGDLKVVVREIEDLLDHRHLNEVLRTDMPTSEFVARWIFDKVRPKLSDGHFWLESVGIEETCTSRCVYTEQT